MRTLLLALLFLGICPALYAQLPPDTLRGAEVHAARKENELKDTYAPGIKRQTFDTATLDIFRQQSLAALLAARSTAFVKSTGLNNFSTLSLRGASAAQSAVYWEGVPLMNSASGLVDVSLLPLAFTGKMWIDYGSSAALRGSGNVGGAIMLADEEPRFGAKQSVRGSVGVHAGSFAQYGAGGNVSFSSKRWFAHAGIQGATAANNFPALDEQGNRFDMPHAAQHQWAAAALLAYKVNNRTQLSFHGQLSSTHREIPPALFEPVSGKQQDDRQLRLLLEGQQQGKRHPDWKRYARLAFLNQAIAYEDSSIGLRSDLSTRQLYAEAGWEASFLEKGKWLLFVPLQYSWLQDAPETQFRIALASSLSLPLLKQQKSNRYALEPAINFRLESFEGLWIALPGANASLRLARDWRLRANVQYTYRAPTLNELYFQPGGNSRLRPEQGWSYDAGLDWERNQESGWSHKHTVSVYRRDIRDWILWLGGAIWTPHNVAAVRSQGIETEQELSWKQGAFSFRFSVNAAFVSSRVRASVLYGDSSVGKQLPYVPPFMAHMVLCAGWRSLMLQAHTGYTGLRYTLSDESNWLDAYSNSGLNLMYVLPMKRERVRVQLGFQNIFNDSYQVVAFRPMPGFNWNLGATLYLGKGTL